MLQTVNEMMREMANAPFVQVTNIVSLVLGFGLVGGSFYLKKKEKNYWYIVALLGAATIVANIVQIFLFQVLSKILMKTDTCILVLFIEALFYMKKATL